MEKTGARKTELETKETINNEGTPEGKDGKVS